MPVESADYRYQVASRAPRWSVGSYAEHVQSGRRRNHKRLSPGRLRRSYHRDRRNDHRIIFSWKMRPYREGLIEGDVGHATRPT